MDCYCCFAAHYLEKQFSFRKQDIIKLFFCCSFAQESEKPNISASPVIENQNTEGMNSEE